MNNIVDIVKLQEKDFNWFGGTKKGGQGTRVYTDVSINKVKGKDEANSYYHLIFRNNCFKHFESTYILMAIRNNRLYFKGAEQGLKLSGGDNATIKNNRYICTTNPLLKKFTGDYWLEFDKEYQLYYIELPLN